MIFLFAYSSGSNLLAGLVANIVLFGNFLIRKLLYGGTQSTGDYYLACTTVSEEWGGGGGGGGASEAMQ